MVREIILISAYMQKKIPQQNYSCNLKKPNRYEYYFYSSQLVTHMIERYHQLITKEHAFFAKIIKK